MKHDCCYSNGIPKSECDKEMLKYFEKSKSKTFGEKVTKNLIVKPIIGTKYKLGLGKKKKQMAILADELHKPIKRKFQKRPVIVVGIDDTWSADLVDMTSFAKFNKEIKYLLSIIDIFSKYAWAVPVKTGASVTKHLKR